MLNILNTLNKREKIFLTITILTGLLFFIYTAFISAYKQLNLLNREIDNLTSQLAKAKSFVSQKTSIERNFQDLALTNIEEGQSYEQQIAHILVELEGLSTQTGLRFIEIRPQSTKNNGDYRELTIEIRFEGKIANLAEFIYKLQLSKNLLKIEKLTLNSTSSEEGLLNGFLEIRKISS